MFIHHRRVQFYETDLMGIIHHSNYLRFLEEARVAWAHQVGLIDYQQPQSAAHFAVIRTRVEHLAPGRFGDDLEINLEVRRQGIRMIFQYKVFCSGRVLALGETTHVPLDKELKPMRLPTQMKQILEKEQWTGTWLLNSSE